MQSASRNSRASPLACRAPRFLPRAGLPPGTTLQPNSLAILRVLSLDFASATMISHVSLIFWRRIDFRSAGRYFSSFFVGMIIESIFIANFGKYINIMLNRHTRLLAKELNNRVFFPIRQECLSRKLAPYLSGVRRALDIGTSEGKIARKIQDSTGIRILGIDTKIQPETFIPVKKYDGNRLPFKDGFFDCAMLIDVLHHTERPDILVKEALRVSEGFLLIKDHYWDNAVDIKLLQFSDYFGNRPYGIVLPYNFLDMQSWRKLFDSCNLEIDQCQKFRYNWLDPCKHVIFKLRRKNA